METAEVQRGRTATDACKPRRLEGTKKTNAVMLRIHKTPALFLVRG
jgi:hypothetical protein